MQCYALFQWIRLSSSISRFCIFLANAVKQKTIIFFSLNLNKFNLTINSLRRILILITVLLKQWFIFPIFNFSLFWISLLNEQLPVENVQTREKLYRLYFFLSMKFSLIFQLKLSWMVWFACMRHQPSLWSAILSQKGMNVVWLIFLGWWFTKNGKIHDVCVCGFCLCST